MSSASDDQIHSSEIKIGAFDFTSEHKGLLDNLDNWVDDLITKKYVSNVLEKFLKKKKEEVKD
jgi:hypothetical protein